MVLTSQIHVLAWNLVDISEIVKDSGFKVFAELLKTGGQVKAINVKGGGAKYSRKDIDHLVNLQRYTVQKVLHG